MNYLRISTFIVLTTLLSFSSCSKDDDKKEDTTEKEKEPVAQSKTISCKINGAAFSAAYPFSTGTLNESGNIYTIALGAVKVSLQGGTTGIALGLHGTDLSSVKAGDVYTASGFPTVYLAIGGVDINNGSEEENATSEETGEATITITKIDHTQSIISGTFSFKALDPDTQTLFDVTDGVFTDIAYD
jgi:hypothetical protein